MTLPGKVESPGTVGVWGTEKHLQYKEIVNMCAMLATAWYAYSHVNCHHLFGLQGLSAALLLLYEVTGMLLF